MRKNILFSLIISLFICFSGSSYLNAAGVSQSSNEMREAESTVVPFLRALISGDVEGMKNYISNEYYDKNRVLLDENTEYPGFLAGYYQGAEVKLKKISMEDGNIVARVKFLFPDKTKSHNAIYLIQEGEVWKIHEISELSQDNFERIKKQKKSKFPIN